MDQLRARLVTAISEETGGDPKLIADGIAVEPFEGVDIQLFGDRVFTEYRFGARKERRSLTRITAEFTARLGEYDVPIAYLYFPDDNDQGSEGTEWVRIGVGAPDDPLESLDVDVVAIDLAREYSCAFRKYNPGINATSLSEKFREIVDFRPASGAVVIEPGAIVSGRKGADVVFVHGQARSGFVGDMLRAPVGSTVEGGSMSVIGGFTMACWVLPEGSGLAFKARSEKIGRRGTSSGALKGDVEVRLSQIPGAVDQARPDSTCLWLAWRLPERPGVFRLIIAALREAARDVFGGAGDVDVRYAVSRVLDSRMGCAGKVKFEVDSGASRGDAVAAAKDLEERVHKLMKARLAEVGIDWGEGETSHSGEIVVRVLEPGEEPWASLIVGR